MSYQANSATANKFAIAWIIIAALVFSQIIYVTLCHVVGEQIRHSLDMEQRVFLRSIFYGLAIMTFPLTTLIRHILVRLNQTMPGAKSAAQRYLTTVIVSQAMMESVGLFGFIMFILGDDFNTLYIFSGLAVLGFFLHRPKQDEYQSIVEALRHHN